MSAFAEFCRTIKRKTKTQTKINIFQNEVILFFIKLIF